MGCSHTRLDKYDDAMACLIRAIHSGFRKIGTLEKDADLDPLRGRADFQSMLATLKRVAVTSS